MRYVRIFRRIHSVLLGQGNSNWYSKYIAAQGMYLFTNLAVFLSIVQKGGIHQEKRIKKIITFGALAVNLFVAKFVTLGQRLIFEGKKTLKKNFWQEVDYPNLQKKITRGRGSQFPRPTCFSSEAENLKEGDDSFLKFR